MEGNFTNHDFRVTGATLLFDAGVPETIVQQRTGHRSLDALRAYDRVTPIQHTCTCMQVAQILSNPSVAPYTSPEEHASSLEDFSVTPEEGCYLQAFLLYYTIHTGSHFLRHSHVFVLYMCAQLAN